LTDGSADDVAIKQGLAEQGLGAKRGVEGGDQQRGENIERLVTRQTTDAAQQ
jgi:hypothetical protein